jgi:hypothetical protein
MEPRSIAIRRQRSKKHKELDKNIIISERRQLLTPTYPFPSIYLTNPKSLPFIPPP